MPHLLFLDRRIDIEKERFVIGRAPDGDLVLPEPSISRKHAQILQSGGKYYLEDLKSMTGTKINNLPVERGELRDHDEFTIGPFTLSFFHEISENPDPVIDENPKGFLPEPVENRDKAVYLLKREFHQELFKKIDLKKISLDSSSRDELKIKTESALEEIVRMNQSRLPDHLPVDRFLKELLDEILGLGPIEPFLNDPDVTEVMVNGASQIYIEKKGKLVLTGKRFMGDEQVRTVIERIVHPLGRRIDESAPMVDARLKDGSRVNAIIPPLSLNGPVITIRRFPTHQMKVENLIEKNSLTPGWPNF